ncbi:MAG: tRNA (adenosine(37)-N6)-threonylcarbamoyltransferase complex transferase subunit TsaD [Desulfovibrionaceae bacterium]|nr:tRNA (adenosine(37)-N6)-threonylcarbamoyltransferase complex transferase subunit TsaD [Desulfovibrionaceae bacterium]
MLVLGIESSCDETAFGLVEDGRLLAESVASQADVHALFGGVVPELASREHYRLLGPLFDEFMESAGVLPSDLSGVAVARGPGLLGSLLVGVSFAKALAFGAGIPLIGVDHLKAHLLAPGLEQELSLPALGLLVSGGHTHIYYVESAGKFTLLGRTLDDAAGEGFDKVAKMLGLPYPGGRALDALARFGRKRGQINRKLFSYPYLDNKNLDFSFSGLKTSVALYLKNNPAILEQARSLPDDAVQLEEACAGVPELTELCASFNHCVSYTLCTKLRRAAGQLSLESKPVKSLIVAGGVAANTMLRDDLQVLAGQMNLPLVLPRFSLCTDNGAMIAYAGYLMLTAGYVHNLNLEAIPRGKNIPEDQVRLCAPIF